MMKKILYITLVAIVSLFAVNCDMPAAPSASNVNSSPAVTANGVDSGVPVLRSTESEVAKVGNDWLVKFPRPIQNGNGAKNVEYRLLRANDLPTIVGSVSPDATTMEISSTAGYPPQGKVYTFNGETIAYTSISGNVLQGLVRGRDRISPQAHSKGQAVYLITEQRELGNTVEAQIPQREGDYVIHYRWQNDYRENGFDGWSNYAIAGTASGAKSGQ